MSNNIPQKPYKPITPFGIFIRQNFPFVEATYEARDNYDLLCKVVQHLKTVEYNQGVAQENLEALYEFINNLDLQDEVNNKLDEMAQDGTLQEIIGDYLNATAIWGFDNVNDMKNATNLINGSYARTLGYYSKNDGGNALYKIREITNQDVIDNGSIISLSANNNLIAELIPQKNIINIEQFGAIGDGVTDDTEFIKIAINYCKDNNITLSSNRKIYKITEDLTITNCQVNFNWGKIISNQNKITFNTTGHIWDYQGDKIIIIENMKFENTNVITSSPALSIKYLEFLNWHNTALTLNSVRDVSNIYYGNDRSDPNTVSLEVNISDKVIDKIQGRGRIYWNYYKST